MHVTIQNTKLASTVQQILQEPHLLPKYQSLPKLESLLKKLPVNRSGETSERNLALISRLAHPQMF